MKSIKEINKYTDIDIDFIELEKDKKTRKIKKIRFIIKRNENQKYINLKEETKNKQISLFNDIDEICADESDEESIVEKLSDIVGVDLTAGDSEKILMTALEGIDVNKRKIGVLDYIKEKIQVCKKYSEYKRVDNPVGLLIRALQENWRKNSIEAEEIKINGMSINEFEKKILE